MGFFLEVEPTVNQKCDDLILTHNENHSHLHKLHGLAIETLWVLPAGLSDTAVAKQPLVVFLHEGLGSVALWRDFPQKLCDALGLRGLVFSRAGYGQSTPREPHQHWSADFMHRQAIDFLPAYLSSLGIDTAANPPLLFGHSDGATIALIYAASYPAQTRAVIALAPHVNVEGICIAAIEQARISYESDSRNSKSMRSKLSRYHADVDSAFYGWCDVWLSHEFQSFDIRTQLGQITCPVLGVQGYDDVYGTMAQIDQLQTRIPNRGSSQSRPPELLKLANCGHSPHVDQSSSVITSVRHWLKSIL
jgi:pimeloyl-ACP methyl ester carboxylesterase